MPKAFNPEVDDIAQVRDREEGRRVGFNFRFDSQQD